MPNKILTEQNYQTYESVPTKYIDNGDGTFSEALAFNADLTVNTKSIKLTLSAGAGSVEIPTNTRYVTVKTTSSTVRVGLVAPEAVVTKVGNATLADLRNGHTMESGVLTCFALGGVAEGRKVYFTGGASDVIEISVL
jgi:hypothetical protein